MTCHLSGASAGHGSYKPWKVLELQQIWAKFLKSSWMSRNGKKELEKIFVRMLLKMVCTYIWHGDSCFRPDIGWKTNGFCHNLTQTYTVVSLYNHSILLLKLQFRVVYFGLFIRLMIVGHTSKKNWTLSYVKSFHRYITCDLSIFLKKISQVLEMFLKSSWIESDSRCMNPGRSQRLIPFP